MLYRGLTGFVAWLEFLVSYQRKLVSNFCYIVKYIPSFEGMTPTTFYRSMRTTQVQAGVVAWMVKIA
ncbi:hypothetical protein [Rickettsia endosymbiont of Orchestes rusci]|uniref:hypothetical protein n=1 Tax=Rickettsia endosymbiont of Orchestes rusci TaxID=3066250 RepID=UPI00313E08F1